MHKDIDNIYLHVPFCDGKCIYCSFYSIADYESGLINAYISAMARELTMQSTGKHRLRPKTLYIGGGTPTVLSPAGLELLFTQITDKIDLSNTTELTVESNPGTLTPEKAKILHRYGVNRLSIGAQSFDDRMLELLRRRHNAAQISAAIKIARDAGLSNISIDLIAALPGVSGADWNTTLAKAIDLAPDHLSVYCLTIEDKTHLDAMVTAGTIALPDNEAQADALDAAMATLEAAGYVRYEISNYAKRGRECRHNTAFWEGADYLGIGASAASRLSLLRSNNTSDVHSYITALNDGIPAPCESERLTEKQDISERLAFKFRMTAPVDIEAFAEMHGKPARELQPKWLASLNELRSADLVSNKGPCWQLTAKGINMADHVSAELLL